MNRLAPIFGFIVLIGFIMLTGALGIFEAVTGVIGFCAFWICPLLMSLLQAYAFCKLARSRGMSRRFTVSTLAAWVALSAGPIVILAGPVIAGAISIALGAILCIYVTWDAEWLSAVFAHEDLNWNGYAFPPAPTSRFATLATVQMIIGGGGIALAQHLPVSEEYGLWIYGPLALLAGCGFILQVFYLKSRQAIATTNS